jgi:T4-like virus tail tube protein gp19
MAVLGNVIVKHDYELQIESTRGVFTAQASAQKVTIGANELEVIEVSVGLYSEKSAGREKVGDLTLENVLLSSTEASAKFFDDWYEDVKKLPAGLYKKNARIISKQNDVVVAQWELVGVFPKNLGDVALDRTASESLMQSILFSVDQWKRVI